jgi:hypothetical protein
MKDTTPDFLARDFVGRYNSSPCRHHDLDDGELLRDMVRELIRRERRECVQAAKNQVWHYLKGETLQVVQAAIRTGILGRNRKPKAKQ